VLVRPAHTDTLLLHVILRPKLDFEQSHFELYFAGDRKTEPLIHHYFHPFIKKGLPPGGTKTWRV
jgi:hypothetical protein